MSPDVVEVAHLLGVERVRTLWLLMPRRLSLGQRAARGAHADLRVSADDVEPVCAEDTATGAPTPASFARTFSCRSIAPSTVFIHAVDSVACTLTGELLTPLPLLAHCSLHLLVFALPRCTPGSNFNSLRECVHRVIRLISNHFGESRCLFLYCNLFNLAGWHYFCVLLMPGFFILSPTRPHRCNMNWHDRCFSSNIVLCTACTLKYAQK